MANRRLILHLMGFDSALFERVARSHTPALDRVLPALSRAANHSKLWLALAGGLALAGKRRGQRAALRGVGSIAVTSALVNLGVKRLVCRPRPSLRRVPAVRHLPVQPLTTSFPSGHAASAAAFSVGVASELPRAGAPLGVLAAAVGYSRVYVGVHFPLDVLTGAGVGAGVALLSRLQWPVLPAKAREQPATPSPSQVEPRPDGRGVALVVNRDAGPGFRAKPLSEIRESLPLARIVEVEQPGELRRALRDAAESCEVLGICGGDGSAAMAAQIAVERDRPLLVVPSGTLNHLARDLRIESASEAIHALERGEVVALDVAEIDGRPFLNTASLGGYTAMLDARAALQKRIGRWPAHLVAVAKALFGTEPLPLRLDGRERKVWIVFIGNCRHEPAGFAPSWRPRLDDGLLDVRLLTGERPLARARLILSILAGRLTRSAAYERVCVRELRVDAPGRRVRLARDGESFDGSASFTVRKLPRQLLAYAPAEPAEAR